MGFSGIERRRSGGGGGLRGRGGGRLRNESLVMPFVYALVFFSFIFSLVFLSFCL